MVKVTVLIASVFGAISCASPPAGIEPNKETARHFEKSEGCFLLYNLRTDKLEQAIGGERCRLQLPACSTFKVPLAVMAFDSGVLADENVILKWDGSRDVREESNRDHNAETWMKHSIVWFSQRLTTELGKPKLQKYLNTFEYGNRDLSGGIDKAWLISPAATGPALRISSYEQLEFMKKLWKNQLPASLRAMRVARELTYLETSPRGARLSGKTGSGFYDKAHKIHLGWFVSHIQVGDREYVAVTSFSDHEPTEVPGYGGPRAKEMTKKFLAENNLW